MKSRIGRIMKKGKNSSIIEFILFICLVVVFFGFAFRKFIHLGVIHWADLISFPPKADYFFKFFFSSWTSEYLGFESQAPPQWFIWGILQLIFRDPALTQKIYFIYPTAFSVVFTYLLIRRFVRSKPARFVGSFVYALTPVGIGNPGGIFFFGHALLPLLTLYLLKIVEDVNKIRSTLIFTVILGIIISVQIEFYFVILPIVAVIVLMEKILLGKSVGFTLAVTSVLFSLAVSFFLIFPTSVPTFGHIAEQFYPQKYVQYFSAEDLVNRIKGTYSASTLLRLFRVSGSAGGMHWLGFNDFDWWTFAGYSLPIFSFLSLLVSSERRQKANALVFAVMALFILGFIWTTHIGLLPILFVTIPLLLVYQHPGMMLQILPLCYAVLVAISLECLLNRFKTKHSHPHVSYKMTYVKSFLLIFVIVLSLSVYGWPYFTGDRATSYSQAKFSVELTAPPSLVEAAKWIQLHRENEGFFRTLWLPLDTEMKDCLRGLDPYIFALPLGASTGTWPYPDTAIFEQYVLEAFSQEKGDIGFLLSIAGIKYIVVYLDSLYIDGGFPSGDPAEFVQILNNQRDLELIVKENSYLIYENKGFYPQVTVFNQIVPVVVHGIGVTNTSVTFNFEEWGVGPAGWFIPTGFDGTASRSSLIVYNGSYSVELTPINKLGVALESSPIIVGSDDITLRFAVYLPRGQEVTNEEVWVALIENRGLQLRYYLETDSSTATNNVGRNFNNLEKDQWLHFTINNVTQDWNRYFGEGVGIQMPIRIRLVNISTKPNYKTVYFDDISISSTNLQLERESSLALTYLGNLPNLDTRKTFPLILDQPVFPESIYNSSETIIVIGNDHRIFAGKHVAYIFGPSTVSPYIRAGKNVTYYFDAPKSGLYKLALLTSLDSSDLEFEIEDPVIWSLHGSGVGQIQSSTVYEGKYAVEAFPDAGQSYFVETAYAFKCNPGQIIEVSAAMKADANIINTKIHLYWYSAEGQIGRSSSDDFGGNYDWSLKKLRAVAPEGTEYYGIRFDFYSGTSPGKGYVDSINAPPFQVPSPGMLPITVGVDSTSNMYNLTMLNASMWYQASIFLTAGSHEIILVNNWYTEISLDMLVVFKVEDENFKIENFFEPQANSSVNALVTKISDIEYKIDLKSTGPTVIYLAESYDPNWDIQTNAQNYIHFKAYGWANGFYLNSNGNETLKIVFRGQEQRDLILFVWALSWLLLITGTCLTARKDFLIGINHMKKHFRRTREIMKFYLRKLLEKRK